jgi:hypothetical protein
MQITTIGLDIAGRDLPEIAWRGSSQKGLRASVPAPDSIRAMSFSACASFNWILH